MLLNRLKHYWRNPDERTRRINRNVVYSVLVKGAGILISLMLVPLTLDYLNAYEYGIWITLNSILTWINYFDFGLTNGMRNNLAQAIARNDFKLGQIYVSSTFFILTVISIILGAVALIANSFVDWNRLLNVTESVDNLEFIVALAIVCLSINFVLRTVGTIYVSFQQNWIESVLIFLGTAVSFVWILILKQTAPPSLLNVAVAFSASPVIVYAVAYPITFYKKYKFLKPRIKCIRREHFKMLGGLGLKFFLLQLECLVIFSTSNFIISHQFSPADVTSYNICYKYYNLVTMVFLIIIGPLWTAITDAYTKRDYQWIVLNMNKMMKVCGLLFVLIAFLTLISQPVFKLWVGDEVTIPYSICIATAIYTAVFMWTSLFCCYSNGTGNLKGQLWSMTIAAVSFIPVAVLLGNIIGVKGVIYAMTFVLIVPAVWLTLEYGQSVDRLKEPYKSTNDNSNGTVQ